MYLIMTELWKDPVAKISLGLVFVISIAVCLAYSIFSACAIAGSYFIGCAVCWLVILYKDALFKYIPQFFVLLGFKDVQKAPGSSEIKSLECDLCSNGKCSRHKPRPPKEPWNGLMVEKDLDDSIRQLYDKILEKFITDWYQALSNDKRFEYSLKQCLKYASSVLLRRIRQVDLPQLISDKLLPMTLSHVNGVTQMLRKHRSRVSERAPTPYYVHPALHSRKAEIDYLRAIADCLMPVLVPQESYECRNFCALIREIFACWVLLPLTDCIADPAVINNCIIALSKTKSNSLVIKNKEVPLLRNFVMPPDPLPYSEGSTLALLFKTPAKLYCFMQYLKRTNCINLLQFCLHVDEINNLLVRPSTSNDQQLSRLQKSIASVHIVYLRVTSSDYLGDIVPITEEQVKKIRDIANISPELINIKTVDPIYQLYDKVSAYLDGLLNDFHCSQEYFELMYGPRNIIELHKTSITSLLRKQAGSQQQSGAQATGPVSRLGHKIRGALKVGAVDGQLPPWTLEHTHSPNAALQLSAWTVQVHNVQSNPNSGAQHHGRLTGETLFRVHAERPGNGSGSVSDQPDTWMHTARERAFHALRSELGATGEWDELPDAKTHSLEERRLSYELFLQSLLVNHTLSRRQIEAVARFLMPNAHHASTNFGTNSNPDNNAVSDGGLAGSGANLYQSVAQRLRKERGQHLLCFTAALYKSIELKTPGSNPTDMAEDAANTTTQGTNSTTNQQADKLLSTNSNHRANPVFGEYFRDSKRFDGEECFHSTLPSAVRGPSQCLLFILVRVLHAPLFVIRVTLALSCVLGSWLDWLIRLIVTHRITRQTLERKVALLIHMLRESVFSEKLDKSSDRPSVAMDLMRSRSLAKEIVCTRLVSARIAQIWPGLARGLAETYEAVQLPALNKQLVYCLFDAILGELFPELNLPSTESVKVKT